MSLSSLIQAGTMIFQGVQESKINKDQASQLQEQANIQDLDTKREAARKATERDRYVANQKVAYLANGVGLSGSPLTILGDTFSEFNQEIAALNESGAAKSKFLRTEAKIKTRSARASLISGVLNAGSTLVKN